MDQFSTVCLGIQFDGKGASLFDKDNKAVKWRRRKIHPVERSKQKGPKGNMLTRSTTASHTFFFLNCLVNPKYQLSKGMNNAILWLIWNFILILLTSQCEQRILYKLGMLYSKQVDPAFCFTPIKFKMGSKTLRPAPFSLTSDATTPVLTGLQPSWSSLQRLKQWSSQPQLGNKLFPHSCLHTSSGLHLMWFLVHWFTLSGISPLC